MAAPADLKNENDGFALKLKSGCDRDAPSKHRTIQPRQVRIHFD